MEHVREIAKRVIAEMESDPRRVRTAVRVAMIDYRLALQGRGAIGDAYVSRAWAVKLGASDEQMEEKFYKLRQLWAAGKLGGKS